LIDASVSENLDVSIFRAEMRKLGSIWFEKGRLR
jgi:hypothetical protein